MQKAGIGTVIKRCTRKGYINTVFTDINVALVTYTLQGIFPP